MKGRVSLAVMVVVLIASACGDSDEKANPSSNSGGNAGSGGVTGGSGGSKAAGGSIGAAGDATCPEGEPGDPPASYTEHFGSGTRLEARYYAAEGLPPIFAGFYDTELGVPCDFRLASDDVLRCLPRSVVLGVHVGYAEAACQTDVWQLSPACATEPGYMRVELECQDKFAIHEIASFAGTTVHLADGENCTGDMAEPSPNLFTAGDEVPAASFVAGTVRPLPGVCRATLNVVETEDGAFGPHELIDIVSDAACEAEVGSCNPVRRAFEDTLFSDDTCMTPADTPYATWLNGPTCRPPDFIRPASGDSDWYRAGPLVETELYAGTGECLPAREQPWIKSIFELGDPVSAEELVTLSSVEQGTGRLSVFFVGEESTALIADPPPDLVLLDTDSGRECRVQMFDDGVLRCIPTLTIGSGSPDQYNDPDCTQPVRTCSAGDCVGSIIYDLEIDTAACGTAQQVPAVWRITGPATGFYRQDENLPCYEGGPVGTDQWIVEAVPDSDLGMLTLETAD